MSKLVPSPDWFVGIDGLDLCVNGHFVDSVTVEGDPIDAGTDNGFTFTSPNWPTTPQGLIFRITNNYPTHPAGSFHYPELPELPTIASFTFVKEKEFQLHETFSFDDVDGYGDRIVHMARTNKYSYQNVDKDENESNDIITFVPKSDNKDFQMTEPSFDNDDELMSNDIAISEKSTTVKSTSTTTKHPKKKHHHKRHHHGLKSSATKSLRRNNNGYHASTGPKDFFKKKYKSQILERAQEKIFDRSLYNKILRNYRRHESLDKKLKRRKSRRLRKKSKHKNRNSVKYLIERC